MGDPSPRQARYNDSGKYTAAPQGPTRPIIGAYLPIRPPARKAKQKRSRCPGLQRRSDRSPLAYCRSMISVLYRLKNQRTKVQGVERGEPGDLPRPPESGPSGPRSALTPANAAAKAAVASAQAGCRNRERKPGPTPANRPGGPQRAANPKAAVRPPEWERRELHHPPVDGPLLLLPQATRQGGGITTLGNILRRHKRLRARS